MNAFSQMSEVILKVMLEIICKRIQSLKNSILCFTETVHERQWLIQNISLAA